MAFVNKIIIIISFILLWVQRVGGWVMMLVRLRSWYIIFIKHWLLDSGVRFKVFELANFGNRWIWSFWYLFLILNYAFDRMLTQWCNTRRVFLSWIFSPFLLVSLSTKVAFETSPDVLALGLMHGTKSFEWLIFHCVYYLIVVGSCHESLLGIEHGVCKYVQVVITQQAMVARHFFKTSLTSVATSYRTSKNIRHLLADVIFQAFLC